MTTIHYLCWGLACALTGAAALWLWLLEPTPAEREREARR